MLALILLFPLALILVIGAYANQPKEEEKHPEIKFDKKAMEEMLKYIEINEKSPQTYEPPVQPQVDLFAYPTREEVIYLIESLKNL